MRFKFSVLLLFILFPLLLSSRETSAVLQAPFVSYLNARVNGSLVVLNWQDPSDTEDLTYEIHRYGEEITIENLEHTFMIAEVAPGIRTFTDKVPGDGPWWYAVLSRNNGRTINILIPWRNSLGTPVVLNTEKVSSDPEPEVSAVKSEIEKPLEISPLRPLPLPLLSLDTMPAKQDLSAEAAEALNNILGPDEGELWNQPEPVILPADYAEYSDGNDGPASVLKDVLDGPFAEKNWEEAETRLEQLSADPDTDEELKARILFYRGECQYFQYQLQDAFLSFLVSSDFYYRDSRKWMIRIYRELSPVP
jgi:hypothetical protein